MHNEHVNDKLDPYKKDNHNLNTHDKMEHATTNMALMFILHPIIRYQKNLKKISKRSDDYILQPNVTKHIINLKLKNYTITGGKNNRNIVF